jgi:branched-chain amino acid transport system ATP-binding protein
LLKIEKLNVHYGFVRALKDISLDVEAGSIICIIGANGAGKSTLLKSISGIIRPFSGRIVFLENDLSGARPAHIVRIGISQVPEGRQIFFHHTVLENLELGAYLRMRRRNRDEVGKDLARIYQLFPVLAERKEQLAGTLSGGEQQMCAIGRALMIRPMLLLIDEMSLGLAPVIVDRLAKIITRVNQEFRLAVLRVEQDVQMALESCHRGYVIENGRIVLEGDGQRLLADPRIRQAYLGL